MFYVFFAWKILEGIFYVFFPILAKLEIDQLVERNEQLFGIIELNSFHIFLVILFIIFWFKLLENIVKSLIDFFQYDYVKMYDNYYSQALYKRLEWVDPWLFLNSRNKRFVWDIIGNADQIWDWMRRFVWDLISNTFVVIWVVTVFALINIWIFIILIFSSVIIYFLEKIKQKHEEKGGFEEKYRYTQKIRILTDQMQKNLSYLMASGGFKLVLDTYNEANEALRKKMKSIQRRVLTLNIFSFIMENISEIWVKIIVGFSIFFGSTSLGTMTLALLYVSRINEVLTFFRRLKFNLNDFTDNLLKLNLFLDITEIKKDKIFSWKNIEKIEIKNMSFHYQNFAKEELKYFKIIEDRIKSYSWDKTNSEKDELHMIQEAKKEAKVINPFILKDINLIFEKGRTYWIVWKNGAWKTTFISLLLNYFNDYKWNILIDSKELKDFKRDFFINNISVVNQIPYVIEGFTIRENLLLWVSKKYDDEFVLKLLDNFWLKKKVLKNRNWLDSKIWYDNDFSWWEKQLIALIRVILQDKKVLIMDEWTNQLDAENEGLVMNELLKYKKDKIVIFITHRMTTIRKVDLIYCLEDWEIKDSWTHKELVGWKNMYSYFWKKQVEE